MVVVFLMHDDELDRLRESVDCRTVLERVGWDLDAAESSANAAKFRGGAAIIIVTHEGRGWFDPLGDARGDVIALAQYLWGGSIGHARKALRPIAGIEPALSPASGQKAASAPIDAPSVWAKARRLQCGSQGWTYLTSARGLPVTTLERAIAADLLREGIYGTVWALHRDAGARACGWEMRGPHYKGFAKGGDKALFWIGDLTTASRFAVAESAIDALSLATIENWPEGTVYLSTGGGFGSITTGVRARCCGQARGLSARPIAGPGANCWPIGFTSSLARRALVSAACALLPRIGTNSFARGADMRA
jgi:hypothetical protein